MIKFDKIILHHSATKDGSVVNTQAIRTYHNSYRIDGNIVSKEEYDRRIAIREGKLFETPWGDIGYNFLIELVNNQYECIVGRSLLIPGAHTKGQNNSAIGICLIGNYDLVAPHHDALVKVAAIMMPLMELYGIRSHMVFGHRDFANKTCPGKLFDMLDFKKNYLYL